MKIKYCLTLLAYLSLMLANSVDAQINPWPSIKKEMRPWTRWWWMGSTVDEKNLDRLLTLYNNAGFGGVEVTPIYGAVGFENRYIPFLSPQWMSMLNFTVKKASSLGMGVDMNEGTGWPFGGPQVTNEDAAAKLIIQAYTLDAGKNLTEKIILKDDRQVRAGAKLQAVTAYSDNGEMISVLDKVDNAGTLNWQPSHGKWQIYAAFSGKTLQMVKRAAPGGEGLVMNHLNKNAVNNYLRRFDTAFHGAVPGIRAFFNDSYEVYNANWSPDLFDEFKKRRGYDLRLYLRELQSNDSTEKVMSVKRDYRETVSDMLLENLAVNWTNWAHKNKRITKYQAHGSPGNLLDLYAASDIPECEAYFGVSWFPIPGLRHDTTDVINPGSNPNIFKFASSSAHVNGKPLTSSETFVWLTDHFKTSLSQCKPEVDKLFLAGINHVFYHGTTYSPEEIQWPGWQFYASSNFTPTNSLWPQVNALNNYIARCQSVLQAGSPDNELLIYWPVYDAWQSPRGTDMQLSMHNCNEWLTPSPFNKLVDQLREKGYSMDFISDRMIRQAKGDKNSIYVSPAVKYRALIIPKCNYMPAETWRKIQALAARGVNVIIQDIPSVVPKTDIKNSLSAAAKVTGDVAGTLQQTGIPGETIGEYGLRFIRRRIAGGEYYFLVNHSPNLIDAWIQLNSPAKTVLIMDPQSGSYGTTAKKSDGKIRVQLQSGESLILRCYTNATAGLPAWKYIDKERAPVNVGTAWDLHFTQGGPELPADQKLTRLVSWTDLNDPKAVVFSGTGEYTTTFNLPKKDAAEYILNLGTVDESAHVWINGQDAGIIWSIPFTARIGKFLKQGNNTIKIEVANLMANRIRDMDMKGIKWRNYHEINFVNINYRPFDASKWKPQPSGLLGPVTITPVY